MEDNDLKKIWKEMHTGMECKSIDIKEIIHKKHSVVISRILHRQKSLICLFVFFFILSVTSNIWHSVLMGRASFPLWVVNIFLLFILFSVIWGYRLFIKSADLCSVKESGIILKKQLERKMHFDFIICVTASEVTRLKRVILRDATNEDKVKERMQNQAADTEKCKNSDFIIYNDEDHMVVQQVLDVLNKLNLKIQ